MWLEILEMLFLSYSKSLSKYLLKTVNDLNDIIGGQAESQKINLLPILLGSWKFEL